jgi:hypothetical protein
MSPREILNCTAAALIERDIKPPSRKRAVSVMENALLFKLKTECC